MTFFYPLRNKKAFEIFDKIQNGALQEAKQVGKRQNLKIRSSPNLSSMDYIKLLYISKKLILSVTHDSPYNISAVASQYPNNIVSPAILP